MVGCYSKGVGGLPQMSISIHPSSNFYHCLVRYKVTLGHTLSKYTRNLNGSLVWCRKQRQTNRVGSVSLYLSCLWTVRGTQGTWMKLTQTRGKHANSTHRAPQVSLLYGNRTLDISAAPSILVFLIPLFIYLFILPH